ncbi:MAG: Crp/Fnr family transcriptional regulator [Rhodospirillaceae bacterium]|nr:Crp/Fnr family transcriptional regulator [Rhodospirillaceae bacterium]
MNARPSTPRNRLLAVLPAKDLASLQPLLEFVHLETRQILEVPRTAITHVHFVESGLVSVVGTAAPDHRIEVGMVGYEGMTGVGVVLGDDRSVNEALVQSAGASWRIATPALRQAMAASPTLTATLLRYIHVLIVQASQTALANGRGKLDERLARWLLMWHDRLRDDNLTITHEFLALLLGVRRQGVAVALHDLESKALIKSTRSLIKILDRAGLQRAANGFYGLPEAEYDRAIGLGARRPL